MSVDGDIGVLSEVGTEVARTELYELSALGECELAAAGRVGRECQRYYRTGAPLDLEQYHLVRVGQLGTSR